ncbi:MAG: FAD:protein FMN transferase [Gammaproteobacteria bacterium]|nr:FAD:protein FMN transferase [Gammaproteobacteria bacterium]
MHIQIRDTDLGAATAAADEIEHRFQTAGQDWYAFGTGELARVNALLARGEAATVSPALAPLIRRAMDLHARSGGRFDPGVCALVRLWQFDSEESLAGAAAPPADAEVQALRARQGTLADLRFDGRTVSAGRPLCIDLGGMAKGSALEQARAILRTHGVTSALLDLGGSSQLAIGRKGPGRWTIGLRHPRDNRVIGRLELEDGEAASTSGDYERGYVTNGHRYHHIIDPVTGRPTAASASATVLAHDAELADAASTALMVAGPARFRKIGAAMGISAALLVTATGELLTTPEMAERLQRDNGGRLPVIDWTRPGEDGEDPDL